MTNMRELKREEKVVSRSIRTIPFYNTTDTTRLQMISKYLAFQAVPTEKSELPKLISDDIFDVSFSSNSEFIYIAEEDGEVIFKQDDLLVLRLKDGRIKSFYLPEYKFLSEEFGTKLRFCRYEGERFNKGDVVFEYYGYENGVMAPGYNARVMIGSLGFLNYEDAVLVSKSFAQRMGWIGYEEYIIPIYNYSEIVVFPDVNKTYAENDIVIKIKQHLGYMEIYKKYFFTRKKYRKNNLDKFRVEREKYLKSIARNKYKIKTDQVVIKDFTNAKIVEMSVIPIHTSLISISDETEEYLKKESEKFIDKIDRVFKQLKGLIGEKHARLIARSVYSVNKSRVLNGIENPRLVSYVIKLKLASRETFKAGDKISTLGANKGVSAIIVPDNLMPRDMETGKPVDIVISTMAIPSRMNLNQTYEFWINRVLEHVENLVDKGDEKSVNEGLEILIELVTLLYRAAEDAKKWLYKEQIKELFKYKENKNLRKKFISEVKESGIKLIVPAFKNPNIDFDDIKERLFEKYGIREHVDVRIKASELHKFITGVIDVDLPDEMVISASISNMYIINLKHVAKLKANARSIGKYSSVGLLPPRGRKRRGGSRIGNYEIATLFTYDSDALINEFIKIKADDHVNKANMIRDVLLFTRLFEQESMKKTSNITTSVIENIINIFGASIKKSQREEG